LGIIGVIIYSSDDKTSDFNFIFMIKYINYNGAETVLNIFDNTFSLEGSPNISRELDKEEMDEIFNEMQKMDIFNFPKDLPVFRTLQP
jgi:hypothetical protein